MKELEKDTGIRVPFYLHILHLRGEEIERDDRGLNQVIHVDVLRHFGPFLVKVYGERVIGFLKYLRDLKFSEGLQYEMQTYLEQVERGIIPKFPLKSEAKIDDKKAG